MFHFEENSIIRLSKQKTKKTNHCANIVSFRLRPLISSPLIDLIHSSRTTPNINRKKENNFTYPWQAVWLVKNR